MENWLFFVIILLCQKNTLEHWYKNTFAKEVLHMTQVDERLAKVGQNLKKFISESKYKTQVSFALDGMGQDPSVIRRWIKHGVNSLSTIIYIAEVLEIDFMELLK